MTESETIITVNLDAWKKRRIPSAPPRFIKRRSHTWMDYHIVDTTTEHIVAYHVHAAAVDLLLDRLNRHPDLHLGHKTPVNADPADAYGESANV